MYTIICIVGKDEDPNINKDHYERATKKDFMDIESARTYKATIAKSREAIITPTCVLDEAIEINNNRLEKESK